MSSVFFNPTIFTEINPIPVTLNLDPEYRKRTLGTCWQTSPRNPAAPAFQIAAPKPNAVIPYTRMFIV
jgi:hypothetical protein